MKACHFYSYFAEEKKNLIQAFKINATETKVLVTPCLRIAAPSPVEISRRKQNS